MTSRSIPAIVCGMGYKVTNRKRAWWKIKDAIKHANYEVWQGTEWVCRKILFLGKDDTFDYLEPMENGSARVNIEKLKQHVDTAEERFHGTPRREHYMDNVLRFIFLKWYKPLGTFKRWLRSKWDWFLFFRAREIEWTPWHYIDRTDNDHIDGYVSGKVGPFKFHRTVDVSSLTFLKHVFPVESKKDIHYYDLNRYGSWGFPTLMVTKEGIDAADIDKLLNQWYSDLVRYKYRHWTSKGARPNIVVADLRFNDELCKKCHYDKEDCRCEAVSE